jgi:hypothetical protein
MQSDVWEESIMLICDFVKRGEGISLGVWFWNVAKIDCPSEALPFLVENNVSEVYMAYCPDRPDSYYRTFIGNATRQGIRVALIAADPTYILDWGYPARDAFFQWFEDYQRAADETERFYGIHMDIEPYGMGEEWQTRQQEMILQYADFVRYSEERCGRNHIELELDIPCWFDHFTVPDQGEEILLNEFCVRHADTTVVMSYRDNAEDILQAGRDELLLGKKYGKKVCLGIETGHVYEDINITFYNLGTVELYEQLRKLRRLVDEQIAPTHMGYSIHWFDSWVDMPEEGYPLGDDFPYDNPHYAHVLRRKTV